MGSFYKIKTLINPTSAPVTATEAKDQAVIEHTDDDQLIDAFINAATNHVETVTGLSLMRQKKRLYIDGFEDAIYLPGGPVQSIDQVQYIDTSGNTQTLSTGAYAFNDADYYLRRAYNQQWPGVRLQANAVWIDYWAGFQNDAVSPATEVPEAIQHAILMLVAEYDRNREARNEMQSYDNPAFDCLIAPYRTYLQ